MNTTTHLPGHGKHLPSASMPAYVVPASTALCLGPFPFPAR
ncbi:hypothetical protein PV336_16405 [Streptomyces sp. MI02-2A]|nr:hypothetical protein [Streptomyces sp. MI02-2A]MDX3260804.1 hypothetical protein [Streptomyces sp. MI02-2A]